MDTKQQAIAQSLNNFEKIQSGLNPGRQASFFDNYWNKGFQLGRFQEKEDFFKPVAQFANWAAENIVEAPLSSPATLYQGGVDISQGKYYSGSGKILKGALDFASIIPIGRAATVTSTAVKGLGKGLGGTVLKEAGIGGAFGAAYGLSEGLIQAETARPEDRLNIIAKSTGTGGGLGAALGGAIPLAGAGLGKTYRYFFPEKAPLMGTKSAIADDIANSVDNFKTKVEVPTTKPLTAVTPEIKAPIVEIPTAKIEPIVVKTEAKAGKVKSLKVKKETPTIQPTRDISAETP